MKCLFNVPLSTYCFHVPRSRTGANASNKKGDTHAWKNQHDGFRRNGV